MSNWQEYKWESSTKLCCERGINAHVPKCSYTGTWEGKGGEGDRILCFRNL